MLKGEVGGLDSTNVPLSCQQGHLFTCHSHNLFMSMQIQNWRIAENDLKNKYKILFTTIAIGERNLNIKLESFLKTTWTSGNLCQGTEWGHWMENY